MKRSSEGEQVVKVELGLKINENNQINHNRPFLSDDNLDSGATFNVYKYDNNCLISDDNVVRTTRKNNNKENEFTSSGNIGVGEAKFENVGVLNVPSSYYYSSGGMTTAAMGFPFTALQWKELERQAMIYKYMMASLPVPSELLYSSFSSPSSTFAPASYFMGKYGIGSGISVRWSGNNKDAEPGRCRRTDGKKWRCSKDVAPNSKYCERHMHRGRPRSRKHVEQQQQQQLQTRQDQSLSNLATTNNKAKDNLTKKTKLNDQPNGSGIIQPCKGAIYDQSLVTNANLFEDSRNLAWSDEQQWHHLMQTNMNASAFQHQLEVDPLNLNSNSGLSCKTEMGSLERPLFDAWSMGVTETNDNGHKFSLSTSTNGVQGNAVDEEMCQIHMGLGLIDSWVTSTATPGGPLAEVLRPGTASKLDISDSREGDFVTPPATAVSSPSGVLQKTLATFSDSSGSNSPVCHNSNANSDMPFQWLN